MATQGKEFDPSLTFAVRFGKSTGKESVKAWIMSSEGTGLETHASEHLFTFYIPYFLHLPDEASIIGISGQHQSE